MTGDPAYIGGAPEDIAVFVVEGPFHCQDGVEQIAAGRMLHALWFAGRSRRVEDKQRMLGFDPFRFAGGGLALQQIV